MGNEKSENLEDVEEALKIGLALCHITAVNVGHTLREQNIREPTEDESREICRRTLRRISDLLNEAGERPGGICLNLELVHSAFKQGILSAGEVLGFRAFEFIPDPTAGEPTIH